MTTKIHQIKNYSEKKLMIIYQSDDYLIVYKPANVNVHHDHHHQANTLIDFVSNYLNFPQNFLNPGIVHRLDKLTSGVLIVARHEKSYQFFYHLIQERKVVRKYFALVKGEVKEEKFQIEIPLLKPGRTKRARPSLLGKRSKSSFWVKKRGKKETLLECCLETGKTHQIRAQLKYINHPIINDPLYYQGEDKYLYLHAYYLEFYDPWAKLNRQFIINLPRYFQKKLKLECII